MTSSSVAPADFGVSLHTGFLPESDPLRRLPPVFDPWEDFAHDLPKLLMSDRLRDLVAGLPTFPIQDLRDPHEWERAMVLLSFIGHGYVWMGERPADTLPAVLAKPWHAVARHLGRPPVLSYASYCLHNWRRLEARRPVELGNIALIQNFLGGEDEEWFVLIHVEIERLAAEGLAHLLPAQEAVRQGDSKKLGEALHKVDQALQGMNATMERMPERCDPYVYFHRVRPYIHGWRNHPDLPNGVVYEGVDEYGGQPQTFRGETGAQSGIVPALDAFLGVGHAPDELRSYLAEMRLYMPPDHRAFVEKLESGPNLRDYVAHRGEELQAAYNACVQGVERFRSKHLEYAARYIFHQAQTDPKNPHAIGTGGTPFMPYLRKHRDETREALVGESE